MLSAARGLGCPQAKAGSISILSVPFSRSSFKSRLRRLEYADEPVVTLSPGLGNFSMPA